MTHSFVLVKSFGFNDSTYLLSACVPFTVADLYTTPQGSYHFALMMERLQPRGLNHSLKVTQ